MRTRIDPDLLAAAVLESDDTEEWTLDELEHSSDLDSLRSAWTHAHDPNE